MRFLNSNRLLSALLVLALFTTALAAWLSHTEPQSGQRMPEPVVPVEAATPVAVPPAEPAEPDSPVPPESLPGTGEQPAHTRLSAVSDDWLDLTYGLTSTHDRMAVAALDALAGSLDFDAFWGTLIPLAEQGNDFALYLLLALRDFMPLSDAALRFGYVEEPYLEQRRHQYQSPNWLHWLFAGWQPDWTPDPAQKEVAFRRALGGHAGAQTLLVSQSAWFTNQPGLATQLPELLSRLANNRWLQLRNLMQLSAPALASAGPEDAAMQSLLRQLRASGHPLTHWVAQALQPTRSTAEQRRSGLLALAQDGYVTALQEVRLLATTGTGRWTNRKETPVALRDAIAVYQQQAAVHPDNPVVSVALCELHWHNSDYQASWDYLQKFAYADAWAEEVEDYTCTRSSPRAYGENLIALGVVTAPQWQQHMDTIDTRRARIRPQEQ